ncbi:MAG: OmpA family protein [Methylococcales bacterium]|nr:OmpA family protein [Methylococcales bacterium]
MVPSLFNPLLEENQKVIVLFKEEYGQEFEPDEFSALGYDNIMLLAHAIKRAQSPVPIRIANMLRHMPPCQGLTGKYQFTKQGDLTDKDFYFKEFHRGKYEYRQMKAAEDALPHVHESCNEIDRDFDTIPNDLDTCPDNSVEEISKGIFLTGLFRGCPIDNDKDKVPDYTDNCPENSLKEISKGVNELGCPLDSDADGKADYEDLCPLNPDLTDYVVGKNCTKDKDSDGITDDIDQCPNNTKEEIIKGVNKTGKGQGCPIDKDEDKVVDYIDTCIENSPLEISQGVDSKGCPADNDHDDILDYQDKCLNTLDAVIIDSQGCGIIENRITLHPLTFYFKSGKSTLSTRGKAYLDAFVGQIKINKFKQIKIIVHTYSEGNSENNQALSDEQALAINDYFQQQNISCEKITSTGKGDSIPIIDKTTTRKNQKNQRIEFILAQFKSK